MNDTPLTIDIFATKCAIKAKYSSMKDFLYSSDITREREGMIRRIMSGQYGHSSKLESKYQELLRYMRQEQVLIERNP